MKRLSRDAEYLTKHGWTLVSRRTMAQWRIYWRKGEDQGPQGWAVAFERQRQAGLAVLAQTMADDQQQRGDQCPR